MNNLHILRIINWELHVNMLKCTFCTSSGLLPSSQTSLPLTATFFDPFFVLQVFFLVGLITSSICPTYKLISNIEKIFNASPYTTYYESNVWCEFTSHSSHSVTDFHLLLFLYLFFHILFPYHFLHLFYVSIFIINWFFYTLLPFIFFFDLVHPFTIDFSTSFPYTNMGNQTINRTTLK